MFLFHHPEEYLHSLEVDRERNERQRRLLRELRGATPPFGEALTRRLAASLSEPPSVGQYTGRERRSAVTPCPEVKEPMTS